MTLTEESNSFAGGEKMLTTITRRPFLKDVANQNFKQLNFAPDAIYEVDLTDWLTEAELPFVCVGFFLS